MILNLWNPIKEFSRNGYLMPKRNLWELLSIIGVCLAISIVFLSAFFYLRNKVLMIYSPKKMPIYK